MSESIVIILGGIFILLIIVFIGIVIYKRRQYTNVMRKNDPRSHYPNIPVSKPVTQDPSVTVPTRSQFNVPASVRSFTSTERGSVIVGVEVADADKLELDQPIAIFGEEIIEEPIHRTPEKPIVEKPQENDTITKLNELIELMKDKKKNGLNEKIQSGQDPETEQIPPDPEQNGPVAEQKVPDPEQPSGPENSVPKDDDPENSVPKSNGRPAQTDIICTVCNVKRHTRYQGDPKKYVCYKCDKGDDGGKQ